ncbi:MAG TPA: dTDP-4-dehydrorhamnose 3,5-epimerase [bacterium]|nr:dTDP-4-dehydrorhamnose 3,5-epimerase [bacterium]
MIDGVEVKPLRVIPDERGHLMEILRCDDDIFEKFGQVYMTTTYPGVIKAWHFHRHQDDNVTAIKGMLKLVLFDDRDGSRTRGELNEFFIGDRQPQLVHIPRGVYHGWKCISQDEAYVINCVTEPYRYESPDEHRLSYNSEKIPYDWAVKMG